MGKFKERLAAKREEPVRAPAPVEAPEVPKPEVQLLAIQRPKRQEAVCPACSRSHGLQYGRCDGCRGPLEVRDVIWTVAEGNVDGVRRRKEKRGDHSSAVMVAELAKAG